MAFVTVNAMRSHRFPLASLGCGCATPRPVAGLGLDIESAALGGAIATAGLLGFAVGFAVGRFSGRVMPNRRRRRHRRRAR